MAYHLLSLYESYSHYYYYYFFLYEFCSDDISKTKSIIVLEFSQYLCHQQEIVLITSFHVITQPWRQLRAILCFHLIMNIFITMPHKLLKFCTHKLQMISQHTDNPCPRARHDAHVRARQNFNMLKITYKQFWARTRSFRAFLNFPSVRVRARVVRARSANEWQKF